MGSEFRTPRSLALSRTAFQRCIDNLLADVRGPFHCRGDDMGADRPEDIAESIFRAIGCRPDPVFVGVSK